MLHKNANTTRAILKKLERDTVIRILASCAFALRNNKFLAESLEDFSFEGKAFITQEFAPKSSISILIYECGVRLEGARETNRFAVGSLMRETLELIESGWWVANKAVQERKEAFWHAESREGCVRTLEAALYDSAKRGSASEKVEALNYFKTRLQPSEIYFGDHIWSGIAAVCTISITCLTVAFLGVPMCTGSSSRFCKDVRGVTSHVTDYFANPGK